MATEQIDPGKLGAGPELDGLVADRIFGIRKIYYSQYDEKKEWPQFIPSGKPWRTHSIDAEPLPQFSTDIAAAWQIVTHLSKPTIGPAALTNFRLVHYAYNRTYACFSFDERWDEDLVGEGNGEYADCLAICRAALKAVAKREQ